MHKVIPLTEETRELIVENLEGIGIKYKFLGDAIIAVVPLSLTDLAFKGCWTGYKGNIEAQQPTQFDYDYLHS